MWNKAKTMHHPWMKHCSSPCHLHSQGVFFKPEGIIMIIWYNVQVTCVRKTWALSHPVVSVSNPQHLLQMNMCFRKTPNLDLRALSNGNNYSACFFVYLTANLNLSSFIFQNLTTSIKLEISPQNSLAARDCWTEPTENSFVSHSIAYITY